MDIQKNEEWKHENRLLLAIEQLALAPRYLFGIRPAGSLHLAPKDESGAAQKASSQAKKAPPEAHSLNAQQFVEFLSLMQMSPKELLETPMEAKPNYKNYANYRELLKKRYGVYLDFQKKLTSGYQNYPDRQLQILSDYLRILRIPFRPDSLERLFRTAQKKFNALESIVSIRYYVKFGMPLRFSYQKLFGKKGSPSRRIVWPLAIVGLGNYLSLIAIDTKDQAIRSFILSCIETIESNLYEDFMQRQLYAEKNSTSDEDFEPGRFFEEDESAHFYRERVRYVLRLSAPSLHHFEHSYNYDFEVIEDPVSEALGRSSIQFTSSDPYEVRRMLFDYGTYAEILEPKDFREGFLSDLKDLIAFYEKR